MWGGRVERVVRPDYQVDVGGRVAPFGGARHIITCQRPLAIVPSVVGRVRTPPRASPVSKITCVMAGSYA
eukprot:9117082-Prorocentrum_lima.AAC.1